ncbi:MAG: gas vesicle protein [Deltaproteobacteria bacterium]|nr:gas vesicle protein [Deltaproteobacteria bacterium]
MNRADSSASQQVCLSGRQVSLVEVLDRVLNKGAVLTGDITISIAGIDLLYVGLNLLISSVETVNGQWTKPFSAGEKVYGA